MQLQRTSTLKNFLNFLLLIFKAPLLFAKEEDCFLINYTLKLFWHFNLNNPWESFALVMTQLSEVEIQ